MAPNAEATRHQSISVRRVHHRFAAIHTDATEPARGAAASRRRDDRSLTRASNEKAALLADRVAAAGRRRIVAT